MLKSTIVGMLVLLLLGFDPLIAVAITLAGVVVFAIFANWAMDRENARMKIHAERKRRDGPAS